MRGIHLLWRGGGILGHCVHAVQFLLRLPPDNATGNFVKVTQRLAVRIDLDPAQDTGVYLAPGLSASVTVHTKG